MAFEYKFRMDFKDTSRLRVETYIVRLIELVQMLNRLQILKTSCSMYNLQ